jgi:hypothetical protein
MISTRIFSVLLLLTPFALQAQSDTDAPALRDVKARVATISRQLRWTQSSEAARYRENRDALTAQIHTSIDGYVVEKADPSRITSGVMEADLREILAVSGNSTEYSGPPYARVTELPAGRSLVIGYKLTRGGGAVDDSAVAFRGYRVEQRRFKLVDAIGSEFDGYGLFTHELKSPLQGETWLLAWGGLSGFNGNKTRLRIYAFDGNQFRTVWSPPDALNVSVEFTGDGFSIIRLDEERYYKTHACPCSLQEDYALMNDGPKLIFSRYRD